ncbi:hypothetical protein ACQCSX_21380 (plasmid) [Pseudarthrobacter sp. P1]|uniref:hypothetical protein n=1 Tax=Pseudarthrobacter sp. P1 TaxID=3418418 RepID=UPI003CEE85CA
MTIQPLPVPTRIFGGEGLISYASRHAARNGTSVEEIERALSQTGAMPKTSHRHTRERLQAWRDLGALHHTAFTTPPEIAGAEVIDRPLCLRCTDGADATGRLPRIGWVCARHRRWLGAQQHDIRAAPELVAAERHYRRVLAPRGILVRSPVMQLARECAIVRTGRSILATRSRRGGISNLSLLTYPETVRTARLITNPGFNTRMLQPELRPGERHALCVRATTGFFLEAEDDESWRAAHRITAMFNAIARELEKRASTASPQSTQTSDAALATAWTIWGR